MSTSSRGIRPVNSFVFMGHQFGLGYLVGPLLFDRSYNLADGLVAAAWVLFGMLVLWLGRAAP